LLGFQWVERRVLIFGPPTNAALRKPTSEDIEADAVVTQHFEGRAAMISKYKEGPRERIFRQLAFAKRGKAINAVTEVYRLAGEENPVGICGKGDPTSGNAIPVGSWKKVACGFFRTEVRGDR